jgi:basic membrane protein A
MRFSAFAAALLAACLAGCSPKPDTPTTTGTGPGTSGGSSSGPVKVKAAIVTDAGGIDDQSFNTAAWAGLKKAMAEGKVEGRYLQSKEQSDYVTNLTTLAEQGHNLVFAVGFLMEDALKDVAPKFPETKFVIIDGSAPSLPNCVSLKFREEEGSFLAGYLAAKVSKTGTIAFVGGMESPLIKKFEVGYRAGAKTARADAQVVVKYVGNWTDVPKGRAVAEEAIRQKADILFAAAGKGGLGALDAIAEKGAGFYGIGVDSDQDGLHKGRILTSMMKGVDVGVYETSVALARGEWKPGEHILGVKEGGVHLSPMTHTRSDVPPAVLAEIDRLQKMIADGTLKVPSTEEQFSAFKAPTL